MQEGQIAPDPNRKSGDKFILAKAMQDDSFRSALLTDPSKALKDAFGLEMPSFMKLEVLEEKLDTFYFVLPYKAQPSGAEKLQNLVAPEMAADGRTGMTGSILLRAVGHSRISVPDARSQRESADFAPRSTAQSPRPGA
jgi:hypothetical protein